MPNKKYIKCRFSTQKKIKISKKTIRQYTTNKVEKLCTKISMYNAEPGRDLWTN